MPEQRNQMDTNTRVLQIFDEYLPVFTGAAIRHNQLAELLREHGITVEVVVPRVNGLAVRETINGVKVTRVPSGPFRDKKLRSIWSSIFLSHEVWAWRKKYDLIHAVTTNEFWVPVFWLAKLLGKPVVLEFNLMQSTEISAPARVLSALAYVCFRWFDAYIPVSTPLMDSLVQRGLQPDKCHLIPVGIYPEKFVPLEAEARTALRASLGLDPHAMYLLFVGSLIHRKGVDILVEMMTLLSAARPDIHLILAGQHDFPEGHPARPFAETTKREIQARGLSERVHLLGRLEAAGVLPWLQTSDIFVFPSRREGLVRVILEAMSVGLPCIASPMDGSVYDMIQPEANGIVVERLDASTFAAQVLRLADDPALRQRLGAQARQTVVSCFDEKEFAVAYKRLFEEVL